MTQEGIRTRRNFPAETWAVVRDAYLGGETAESIQKRLGISVNSIRKRAGRCGWTHAAHARAIARAAGEGAPVPNTPEAAMIAALDHAALALAEGRASDATALIRAAESMGRVAGFDPADTPLRMSGHEALTPEQDAAREAAAKKGWDDMLDLIEAQADVLARRILAEIPGAPAVHSGFVHAWRAQNLPGAAAADHAAMQARAAHRVPFHWDDAGQPLPVEEVRAMYYGVYRRQIRARAGLPAVGPEEAG
ncbi:hypothetical protein [Brevundimonas sp. UBA7664]|uniref:hypothetical protein n=1 Tax=Brevundimonas sp. UBA7664 TaxID=1946141 RepID=UPI0025BC3DB1|nr:hypothetical protein [Brevundimonas sp. UBA7664]